MSPKSEAPTTLVSVQRIGELEATQTRASTLQKLADDTNANISETASTVSSTTAKRNRLGMEAITDMYEARTVRKHIIYFPGIKLTKEIKQISSLGLSPTTLLGN